MSRYGRGDFDDMAYELDEFLENHPAAELLRLVTDAVDWYEEKKLEVKTDKNPMVHGQWRPHFTEPYENEGEVYWWVCSECEEVENRKSDYCPNCGAKMDG